MNRFLRPTIAAMATTAAMALHASAARPASEPDANVAAAGPRGPVGPDVPLTAAEQARSAERVTVEGRTVGGIQAACDRAAREGVPVVFLPAGVYELEATVRVPGGLTLLGEGAKTHCRAKGRSVHLFRADGDRVRFSRLKLEGTDTTPNTTNDTHGVDVSGKRNIRIDHCELMGFSYATNAGDEATAQIDHCLIHHNLRDGLGYGVVVHSGAFVVVCDNEFSQNRHSLASNGALDWSSPKRLGKYVHKPGIRKTHWEFIHNRVGSNDESPYELCAVDAHPGMDGTFVVERNIFENLRHGLGIRDGSGIIQRNVFRKLRTVTEFRPLVAISIGYGTHNDIPVEGCMPHSIAVKDNVFLMEEGVEYEKCSIGKAKNIAVDGELIPETKTDRASLANPQTGADGRRRHSPLAGEGMMMRAPMQRIAVWGSLLCIWDSCFPGEAEWPQWRGPNRDGVSSETGLLEAWPEGGPKLLWTAKGCGEGYAAPAIAGGTVYIAGDVGEECFVMALGMDGRPKWKTANGNAWSGDYPGARGTPTVGAGMVHHLNAHGDLACLDARSGKKLWSRNVLKEFGAKNITWALAESVLVDGDSVICRPGGREACVVALDRRTGKTVWTSVGADEQATHSSSISFTFAGIRHVIVLTTKAVVAVNAEDGEVLWRHPLPWSNQTIPTPIYSDGCVFVTTGNSCVSLKLTAEDGRVAPKELWRNDHFMTYMSGAVLVGGHLYGFHGVHTGSWCCVDSATGRIRWAVRGVPKGGLTCADGMLFCVDERGTVSLVKAAPETYRLISQFEVPRGGSGPTWAPPVVCGGRLYIRHGDCLHAFDVAGKR